MACSKTFNNVDSPVSWLSFTVLLRDLLRHTWSFALSWTFWSAQNEPVWLLRDKNIPRMLLRVALGAPFGPYWGANSTPPDLAAGHLRGGSSSRREWRERKRPKGGSKGEGNVLLQFFLSLGCRKTDEHQYGVASCRHYTLSLIHI